MNRLLLTSQMIHNRSIADSLAKLLDKPFKESVVAYIVTSHNAASPGDDKGWLIDNLNSIYNLGWKKFCMIDIAGLNGLDQSSWQSAINSADVIVMGGGANFFLSYWLEESGLTQQLPELLKSKVYVGASAGSMLATPSLVTSSDALEEFSKDNWQVKISELGPLNRRSDKTLSLVDFLIRPHYAPNESYINDDLLQKVSTKFATKIYALDDDSAVEVLGDQIRVISEGEWKLFKP